VPAKPVAAGFTGGERGGDATDPEITLAETGRHHLDRVQLLGDVLEELLAVGRGKGREAEAVPAVIGVTYPPLTSLK
jgi:hypothetical protein